MAGEGRRVESEPEVVDDEGAENVRVGPICSCHASLSGTTTFKHPI